jgi:hypothetical protein
MNLQRNADASVMSGTIAGQRQRGLTMVANKCRTRNTPFMSSSLSDWRMNTFIVFLPFLPFFFLLVL